MALVKHRLRTVIITSSLVLALAAAALVFVPVRRGGERNVPRPESEAVGPAVPGATRDSPPETGDEPGEISDVTAAPTDVAAAETPPVLPGITSFTSITSGRSGGAVPGDVMSVTFALSRPISATPKVTIGGLEADVKAIGTALYRADTEFTANHETGPVGVIIEIFDEAAGSVSFGPLATRVSLTAVPVESAPLEPEPLTAAALDTPPAAAVPADQEEPDPPPETLVAAPPLPEPEPAKAAGDTGETIEEPASTEISEPAVPGGPFIDVVSPADGSEFGAFVEVRGAIGNPDSVSTVRYRVVPESFLGQESAFLQGTATADRSDGSFSFVFSTGELRGSQEVLVAVEYEDGNVLERTLILHPGDGAIPSFTTFADDLDVTLRWDDLPLSAGYSVSVSVDGSEPVPVGRSAGFVSSPLSLRAEEGRLYSFRVSAIGEDGSVIAESTERRVVPLTEEYLVPSLRGAFERIHLSWNPVEGPVEYVILRSESPDGSFRRIGSVSGSPGYTDTTVVYGREYRYRIGLAACSPVLSRAVDGRSLAAPENRVLGVGAWTGGDMTGSAVSGSYLYAAASGVGLLVFDVSDPSNPVQAGSSATADARDVALFGDLAFVADGERGLKIINVADPTIPSEVGSRKTSDARAVAVYERADGTPLAFVADGEYGMKVIDAANPRDPVRIMTIPGAVRHVAVLSSQGRGILLMDGTPGAVSVMDPEDLSAAPLSTIPADDIRGMAGEGHTLYIADRQGMTIYDMADPRSPERLSVYSAADTAGIAVTETFAFLARSDGHILVIDVSSKRVPRLMESIDAGPVRSISVRDNRLFVAGPAGIRIMEIYTRGRSTEIGGAVTGGSAHGISLTVSGSEVTAWVADHRGGVSIYDASDPRRFGEESLIAIAPARFARSAVSDGTRLYVADGPFGIKVFDVGDRSLPVLIGASETDGNAAEIATDGRGTVYLADGTGGLKVFSTDLSGTPRLTVKLDTGYAAGLSLSDSLLCLADSRRGLVVYRLGAAGPEEISSLPVVNARSVFTAPGRAYVVGYEGVSIVDLTDPSSPSVLGTYKTAYAESVAADGEYVYVAEGLDGLTVLDVTDPRAPYPVSVYDNPFTLDAAVLNGRAFITDSEGIKIIEIVIPSWAVRGDR